MRSGPQSTGSDPELEGRVPGPGFAVNRDSCLGQPFDDHAGGAPLPPAFEAVGTPGDFSGDKPVYVRRIVDRERGYSEAASVQAGS